MSYKPWVLGLALGLAVGLTASAAQEAGGSGQAKRISAAEAKAAFDQGKAVLVDVRAKGAYDAEHAKGSISIPLSDISARSAEIPKDKLVILYCT